MTHSKFPSDLGRGHRVELVMQTEATECALACMAMIARYHGHEVDLPGLRRRFSTSLKGMNLARLIEIARALGFEARPLRTDLEYLSHAQQPCIAHWDMNHFVVLDRVTRKGAEIYDPAKGCHCIPLAQVGKHFTGVLLELTPSADFTPVKDTQRVSLRALTGRISGLGRALTQILGLALAIEILALVMPFQIQWVVDQVLVSEDTNLLIIITFGFLIAIGLQTGLTIARAWVLSWLGATLEAQWITNLFSHLMKLPLEYFEKRHMGDVVSRFSSVQSIQNTLTSSFAEAVLDGLMGSLTLIILSLYSLPLTGCVLASLAVYMFMRWAFYRRLWMITEEQLIYTAKQQTEMMESVRGVQTIKLASKQSDRVARLANATQESAKRTMQRQRITLAFSSINHSLFGVQRIILIALGAYLALRGKFSAGMLIAFVTYADQIGAKFGGLIDKVVEFRMLRLHAERIADIAFAEPERNSIGVYSGPKPESRIEIRNLSFRYADGEPWVLRHLDLIVQAGESVAITGPSGCGKSTLAKILLGLLEPVEGSVLIGGVDIRRYGLDNYRRKIGAVMQNDALFAGSIADNISFFDDSATLESIMEAAIDAEIHREIIAMPMAYESMVGDMGSVLSGGQKQRLLLARALFRKPDLLILDEATSHLDVDNERAINRSINRMNVTRVIIAHRKETIASADRVVNLEELSDSSKSIVEHVAAEH